MLFNFLLALKSDRKRLKAEKFDLLNQMKQLYGTLGDKEKELREFIRSFEQVNFFTPSSVVFQVLNQKISFEKFRKKLKSNF